MITHILSALCGEPWAITARAMETMLKILEEHEDQVEAVAARTGPPLRNTGGEVENRNGVAVLSIEGPIFRKANLITECSGATSVSGLAKNFNTALDDASVHSILLHINSPGGEADGVGELASMIHGARGHKPVAAYIGSLGASGAYWLASAASKIVINKMARAGSIGVVASIRDYKGAEEKAGIRNYEIVSSQSPLKRTDPGTDEGRGLIQTMVDDMAAVFVESVAQYRGKTAAHVLENFGKGSVLSGAKAVSAGMADAVGTFEGLVAELQGDAHKASFSVGAAAAAKGEDVMAEETTAAAAQDRIKGILYCEEAKGREGLAKHLAFDTENTVEAAKGILNAAPAAKTDEFAEKMRTTPNPTVGAGKEKADGDDYEAEVKAILEFVPAANRARRAG